MSAIQTWINPRIDRSGWPAGIADGECDKAQWTDAATGLVCLAKRHHSFGHWCGYVGVDNAHPWHGKGYDDLPHYGPAVHGGVTYAAACEAGPPEQTICHIPEPGQPDGLWWFGFDCAHSGDLSPGMSACYSFIGGHYRDFNYVQAECARMARQIKAAGAAP